MPTDSLTCHNHGAMHSDIKDIKRCTMTIEKSLSDGKTEFALLKQRMTLVEQIVFSACGLILISVLGAIVGLAVINSGDGEHTSISGK